MKSINAQLAGLIATVGIGLSLSLIAPSPMAANESRPVGGIFDCEDTGPIECVGILQTDENECSKVKSTSCDMLGTVPNGNTQCQKNPNQSNACAGVPPYICTPPDYVCR